MYTIGSIQPIFDHMPGVWVAKDLNSRIVYCNSETARMNGLQAPDQLLGLTDYDLPSRLSECAEYFRSQDQKVIEHGSALQVIDVLESEEGDWKVYLGTKTVFTDHKGAIAGTIFHAQDMSSQKYIELCQLIASASQLTCGSHLKQRLESFFLGSNPRSDLRLAPKESECLFYVLRGKTVKQIAKIQNVSPRTIEDHLNNLKYKFKVQSKAELISVAIDTGFMNMLPPGMFNHQLSIVLDKN